MVLPFTKLPGYNSIFIDYIYNFDKVSEFYQYDYSEKDGFYKAILNKSESYLHNKEFTRDNIADILKIQNKFFNSSDAVYENIELLRNENTFAVVTGQQAGILTGNYYTILKAVNTYQLCLKLKDKFPEYNFVPVFWLEADDHDFLEVNNVNYFNNENLLTSTAYFEKGVPLERYLKPVDSIVIDEYIEKFKEEISTNMLKTDYSDLIFDFINRSYKAGISFSVSFARLLNYLIGDLGIILCNPAYKEIKKLLIPIFQKELNTYPATCEKVIDTSAIIEQRYEPQVKPQPINVFYTHNTNRYLIEPRTEDMFALKNSRQKFSKQEIFDVLYSNPENFSANVILRPICQDFILPTIAYIGGPSEIAYFAQYKDVYSYYNIDMPVIYPRVSVTILENRISNFLSKYNVSFEELFDEKKVSAKFMNRINELKVNELFGSFNDEINALIYSLSKDLEKIDKNLLNTFRSKNEKYFESIKYIKEKFIESQIKQNESSVAKLNSVIQNVFPDGILQERNINIIYFLNKYGLNFIGDLINKMEIDNFNHQIINITVQGKD